MGELIDEGTSWGRYAKASGHMDGVTKDENGQLWKNGHPFHPEHGGELPGDDQACERPPNADLSGGGGGARRRAEWDAISRGGAAKLTGEPGFFTNNFLGKAAVAGGRGISTSHQTGHLMEMNDEGFAPPAAAQGLMNALDAEFPKGVPAQGEVWDIDMTVAELMNMAACDNLHLYAILQFLKANWVGGNPDREHDVRAGTMYCYVDEDGHLRLDFRSRFTVNKGLMPQIQGVIARAGELAPEVMRMAGDVCKELNDKMEDQTGCCGFGDHSPEEVAERARRMAQLVSFTKEADRTESVHGEDSDCNLFDGL